MIQNKFLSRDATIDEIEAMALELTGNNNPYLAELRRILSWLPVNHIHQRSLTRYIELFSRPYDRNATESEELTRLGKLLVGTWVISGDVYAGRYSELPSETTVDDVLSSTAPNG